MDLKARIQKHGDDLIEAAQDSPFIVFLCGPTLDASRSNPSTQSAALWSRLKAAIYPPSTGSAKPSARLRARLQERLKQEGFDVVLGEDEGLENARLRLGINAQDNELEFIRRHCNAVIVIADSVGAFCELGLFSWHFVHEDGVIKNGPDFILLVDQRHRNARSYLNEGPFNAVTGFGLAQFVNLGEYLGDDIIARLKSRRGVFTVDRRGRPHKPSS